MTVVTMEEQEHPVTKVLREIMAATKLRQQGMAKKTGISQPQIALMLSGKSINPSWDTLAKIIATFGVDPRLLFPPRFSNMSKEKES